jgi:hypothetical protein
MAREAAQMLAVDRFTPRPQPSPRQQQSAPGCPRIRMFQADRPRSSEQPTAGRETFANWKFQATGQSSGRHHDARRPPSGWHSDISSRDEEPPAQTAPRSDRSKSSVLVNQFQAWASFLPILAHPRNTSRVFQASDPFPTDATHCALLIQGYHLGFQAAAASGGQGTPTSDFKPPVGIARCLTTSSRLSLPPP